MKIHGLLVAVVAVLGVFVPGALAAQVPAPGLKVIGATGPTHLPPRQSEVQRVTLEAEGGGFRLGAKNGEGAVTPVYRFATVSTTAGSPVATIEGGEAFEVGARVSNAGLPFEEESFVISCSSDCVTPESTVTFSNPSMRTSAEATALIQAKEATVLEGTFSVGEQIRGSKFQQVVGTGEVIPVTEYFPSGTSVTSVSGSTIGLSKPPTISCNLCEEIGVSAYEATEPIAFDAAPATVQASLESIPLLGVGSVAVSGGPGGDAAHPYLLAFGGRVENENVDSLIVDESELTGPHRLAKVATIVPGGNGTGEIAVLTANLGAVTTSGSITARVGPLPPGIVTASPSKGIEWICPGGAGETTVVCTTTQPIKPLRALGNGISIPIEVRTPIPFTTTVPVELTGGGAPAPATYPVSVEVSKEPSPFGVAAAFGGSYEADGSPSVQAGGHPFGSAAYFLLKSVRLTNGALTPAGESKNIVVDLPPGFVGNPLAGPRCPPSLVVPQPTVPSKLCGDDQTVGNLDPLTSFLDHTLSTPTRLYNDVPPAGVAAEFSSLIAGIPAQSVLASVNSEGNFGIRLTAPNNPNLFKLYGAFTAFEGVPVRGNGAALLTNPTNCSEPTQIATKASTYQEPTPLREFNIPQPTVTGCDQLKFEAKDPATGQGQVAFSFTPSAVDGTLVESGSTPVGAEAHLHVDQDGLIDPTDLATPQLKRAVIQLPEGLILNPSSANGLEGCSEAQIGYLGRGFPLPNPIHFNESQPSCPDGSKLGSAEVKTPLIDAPLVGEVFLANQEANPFGSLLAVYLVVNDPYTGVIVKLPGEVRADPNTGRLTAIFDDNPQLPFSDLTLRFRGGGPQSLFATSEVCGSFSTQTELTPWSAPQSGPPARPTSATSVTSNCATTKEARAFSPYLQAGTSPRNAGGYNPLLVSVERKDGEQELTHIDFTLPEGLIGKLAGIASCSDAAISEAERRTGREEQASSSCPPSSRIGAIDAGAGVGSAPLHVGGNLYLAGPYRGAPVSTVAVVPAVAGPLDLGDVVVRAPLDVDRETAALTARTDAIPTILQGIPLKIRSVAIKVDRPSFILDPTNCAPMTVTSSLGGDSGASARPTYPFQAAACDSLRFTPRFKVSLRGGTRRNGNPALTATLIQPFGQANIGRVSVALPHSEFLEQSHIRGTCTRVLFAADQCPIGSIYGHAEAVTPLLDQPLRGPVYLRSSSHKLPDLVVVLKGPASQPIEIDLDGRIDSVHGGIRATFEDVPDAPVSRFVLRMRGGRRSLIVNSTSVCNGVHRATVRTTGQNASTHDFRTRLAARCPTRKNTTNHRGGRGKKPAYHRGKDAKGGR